MNRREFIETAAAFSATQLVARASAPLGENDFHVCPKSRAPARTLCAFRTGDLTSYSWEMRLTLSCLQGLVNRSQPQFYLIHDRYDELWLDWLQERGDVDKVVWLEIGEVFERFLPGIPQMFIIDPAVPATINVATMLAGVRGGLVAAPGTADQFNLPMGVIPDSSTVGLDLRSFGWKKDIDAYRWAFQQLSGQLSKQAIAILAPQEAALRDYLVEFKIPILWISGPQDEDRNPKASSEQEFQFAREILMQWPPNIPCLGWTTSGDKTGGIGETPGVRLASQCAKYTACTAFDAYSPTVGNLSVHSGTTATFKQAVPPVTLEPKKIHLALIRSDGDGLNFHRHYYRKLFDDPKHGSVPIGWQIGPTATDLHPDLLDYYYRHARPGDSFLNALTGMGYIHEDDYALNYPPEQQAQVWKEYLRLSSLYRGRLDASILSTYSEMQPDRFASLARGLGIQGIFANYGRSHATTLDNLLTVVEGTPVFRAINRPPGPFTFTSSARRDAEFFMVNEIKRWTPLQRPCFLHVFLANWLTSMEMAENIVRGLGDEYVVVRPDQLPQLCKRSTGG
ncbi:MAG TPA: GxGYxYP domain-containing protein [Terriglobia bacterium]|nr:GxGYxYP domain-containing protein [Terriglobia bacterium]